MAQLFHRSTNTIAKVSIFGAVFIVAGLAWVLVEIDRSGYSTRQGVIRAQPIPFSHDHHTAGLGIDCRYCHTTVETAAMASVPPTSTCMNCHKLIWKDSPMLEPVRASFRTGQSVRWQRVYDLPDFVYFDHSVHVAKGIGCVSCHGRVDQMPLISQAVSLQMGWCLECHRHPEKQLRPKDAIVKMDWQPDGDGEALRAELAEKNHVRSLMSCSVCHR